VWSQDVVAATHGACSAVVAANARTRRRGDDRRPNAIPGAVRARRHSRESGATPPPTEAALIEHSRKSLTGCMVPEYVQSRDEPPPKSPVGRVPWRRARHRVERETAAAA